MADLGSAYLRVLPDTSGLNARLGAYFSGSQFSKMGKAAGVALGAGIAAGGAVKALYEIGQAFDDASDKIRVGTGATGKQLDKLNKSFDNVVKGVPADFDSASTSIADLNTRLGLTGKPLEKLSKQMLELSRITDTDVSSNIQAVTRVFGDWDVKTQNQSKSLDELYRASQATGVGVSDLASQMVQFGSPLRQLGFSFESSAAMFAEFEKVGVNTQTLMPGLRMAIKNLAMPTTDLSKKLDQLGIDASKPDQALQDLFTAIQKATPDKAKALAFEVFGTRAGPDMAEAISQGRFELEDLQKTIEEGSDTVRKAGKDTMDFGEQWTLLKNDLMVSLRPLASKVFGALGDEMERVRQILTDKHLSSDEKFTAIMDEIQQAAGKWGPKIAEAGGKLGIALIKGIGGAFLHSDLLGKLFIGGAALRLFGGPEVFTKLGGLMGKSTGGSFGGGFRGAIAGIGPTAAITAAGYFIGNTLMDQIEARANARSDDIAKALEGIAKGGNQRFSGNSFLDTILGTDKSVLDKIPVIGKALSEQIFGDSAAPELAHKLQRELVSLQGPYAKINDAGRQRIRDLEDQLNLTTKQRAAIQKLMDAATDVSAVKRATANIHGSYAGAFDFKDIKASFRSNLTELNANFDQGGKEFADLSKTNFYDARDAIYKAMHDGEVSVRKGTRLINQLAKQIDLKPGEDSFDKLDQTAREKLKGVGDSMKAAKRSLQASYKPLFDDMDQSAREAFAGVGKSAEDSQRKTVAATGKMQSGVSTHVQSLVRAFNHGMGSIATSTDNALKALGVGGGLGAGFSVGKGKTPGKQHGGIVHAMKGMIVPGYGSGDTVPLHIGGQLAAMVEPRELVSVTNRTATADLMAHNKGVPRRATGGIVPVPGFPGESANSRIIPALSGFLSRFNLWLSDAYGPGHASPEHTQYGTAADIGPKDGDWGKFASTALRYAVGQGWTPVYYDGSNGTTAAANHGPGNHAHVTLLTVAELLAGQSPGGGKGIAGAVAEQIKQVVLNGPDGPLKDIGQASLDKVRKAANSYIASKAPTSGPDGASYGGVSGGKYKGSLDRDFGKGSNQTISFDQAAMLAEKAGLPGVTYAQIAQGESALRPGAVSSDGGYGLWQMTPRVQSSATVSAWNRIGSYFNPWDNARMAKVLAGSGTGVGNYYGTGFVTDSNKHYTGPMELRDGGVVEKARGAIQGLSLEKTMGRLKKLKRKTAQLDESINVADVMAGRPDSPDAEDYSTGETASLLALNERLLKTLQTERSFALHAVKRLGGKANREHGGSAIEDELARHTHKASGIREDLKGVKDGKRRTALEHELAQQQKQIVKLRGRLADQRDGRSQKKGDARGELGDLNQLVEDLQGVTGKGGRLLDVGAEIARLRAVSAAVIDRPALGIDGLSEFYDAVSIGAFARDLPKFHSGGQVPGSSNQEVPIMARGGEYVVTKDQYEVRPTISVIIKGDIISDHDDPVEVMVGDRRFKAAVKREIGADNSSRRQARLAGRSR